MPSRLLPLLPLAFLAAAAPARAADWYARGNFYAASNELGAAGPGGADTGNLLRDDGTGGDAVAGDGILSREITATVSAGIFSFKVESLDGSSEYPEGSEVNVPIRLTQANQPVLVTFDTNVYADGWFPPTHVVWCDRLVEPQISWCVVGDAFELGSWSPPYGLEAHLQANGLYLGRAHMNSAGAVTYKWTADLAWNIQEVSAQGICVGDTGHDLTYDVPSIGDYDFALNPATGRVTAGVAGTVAAEDVSWSRIKELYVDGR